jgi:electron transport complex protein RnfG
MLRLYMRLGIPVLVVCIIAAAGLALTYAVTKDRIAAQDREAKARSLRIVLPDATTFAELDATKDAAAYQRAASAAGDTRVDGLYRALDGSGAQVGWGVLVAPRGYGGPISMAVGVDRNGKVTGATIISMNETPGLGTKVLTQEDWLPRFVGLDTATGVDSVRKVDTIMGATKTSRGVRNGVGAAAAIHADVLKSMEGGAGQ